jgi:dynein heavy chain
LQEFTYETMRTKSAAAANLCNWIVNIVQFNRIYKKVCEATAFST